MEVLFWALLALVVYAYLGYPLLLWLITRFVPPSAPGKLEEDPRALPRVSVMLPAHNEEKVIRRRIENLLALDYPPEKIEIVVGSDASTDDTVAIARSFDSPRVHVLESTERGGKTSLLNRMVDTSSGELIVYTDANCQYDASALRYLAAPFRAPRVGCVIGELVYVNVDDPEVGGGEGLYWRFENAVKELESRLGGTIVANGSIYAMRRELFRPLPGFISDDSVNPLLVLRDGYRVLFERRAIAREKAAERLGEELGRKSRMVTRQLGSHAHVRSFLWPLRPTLAFRLVSHKLLRWLVPVFLIGAALANLALLDRPFYRYTLALTVVGAMVAALGAWRVSRAGALPRLWRVWVYFCAVNVAALKGLIDFVRGSRRATWKISETTR